MRHVAILGTTKSAPRFVSPALLRLVTDNQQTSASPWYATWWGIGNIVAVVGGLGYAYKWRHA